MVHALTVALQEFQGAMIVVSHDRHLLASTVDEFYSIHEGVFAEFKGDLHDYEKSLLKPAKANRENCGSEPEPKTRLDKKGQRQLAAARREQLAPLRKQEKAIETVIEKIQLELANIETQLANESIYSEENRSELGKLLQTQGQLKSQLDEKEQQWLSVLEKITQD